MINNNNVPCQIEGGKYVGRVRLDQKPQASVRSNLCHAPCRLWSKPVR